MAMILFGFHNMVLMSFENLRYDRAKVVAEIGCNHQGDFDKALELIRLAQQSGADYAKFQKRDPRTLLTEEQYNTPHRVSYHAFGETYGAHREFLEFDMEQHKELKAYCENLDIAYACSVWDIPSAHDIIALNPEYIKVPSACNNHIELLKLLRDSFAGDVHISLGMSSREEESSIEEVFEGHRDRLVLYACTSAYPVDFDNVCLLEIRRLLDNRTSGEQSVGFSGHHLGIAIDIAAYTLGASWIERHFTKDRTWKGTDHAASLEPAGLGKLVRDLSVTYRSLSFKSSDLLEIEKEQREKLKHKN